MKLTSNNKGVRDTLAKEKNLFMGVLYCLGIIVLVTCITIAAYYIYTGIRDHEPTLNPYGGRNDVDYVGDFTVLEIPNKDGSLRCSFPVKDVKPPNKYSRGCPDQYEGMIFTPTGFKTLGKE